MGMFDWLFGKRKKDQSNFDELFLEAQKKMEELGPKDNEPLVTSLINQSFFKIYN